jgi:predicted RND superfamily exporter protein
MQTALWRDATMAVFSLALIFILSWLSFRSLFLAVCGVVEILLSYPWYLAITSLFSPLFFCVFYD